VLKWCQVSKEDFTILPGVCAGAQGRDVSSGEEVRGGRRHSMAPFWGGYRTKPTLTEFWHDQANRLHERLQFTRHLPVSEWEVKRLSP
jgi:pyridoxine/pyridoxamine 5'-phosphate oxidase